MSVQRTQVESSGRVCQPGEAPAEVEGYLRLVQFPATRDELVTAAKEAEAPEAVIVALEALPQEWFGSLDEVCTAWQALP
jgi:hypothetical protein